MSHYAFRFKYSFGKNKEGKSNEISEYFLPYSLEELKLMELPGQVGVAVDKLTEDPNLNEPFPLDKISAGEDTELLLSEDYLTEIQDINIAAPIFDDDGETFRTSLWDILSEAKLIKYASDLYLLRGNEALDDIKRAAEATVCSQIELDSTKVELSLYAHLALALGKEMEKLRAEGTDIAGTLDLLDTHERIEDIIVDGGIPDDIPEGIYKREDPNAPETDEEKTKRLIGNIYYYLNINKMPDTPPDRVESNKTAVAKHNRELLEVIWKPYEEAFFYYRVMRDISDRKEFGYYKHTREALRTFINTYFDIYRDGGSYIISEQIRYIANNVINCMLSFNYNSSWVSSGDFGNGPTFDDMKDFFDSDDIYKKASGKYGGDGGKCFALLITDHDKHYFSLSGIKKELNKAVTGNFHDMVKCIMENILNMVPAPDIYAQTYEYNFAFIHKRLDVRRYTDILQASVDYDSIPKPYLQSGFETFDKDILKNPNEDYGTTYGCCERKMLAYSGYDHAKFIFSKYAPCWKCCPAVCDAPGVRFFAFGTLDDFKALGAASLTTLKEYKISSQTTYSAKVI